MANERPAPDLPHFPRFVTALAVVVIAAMLAGLALRGGASAGPARASDWLSLLPAGEAKRKFILDCSGCHGFDSTIAFPEGKARTNESWKTSVDRMLGFAGATSGFPVIAHDRDAAATATFLARHVSRPPIARPARGVREVTGAVTEFDMPVTQDLPHDVAVDGNGRVVVTGMFSNKMFVLDPETGLIDSVAIPVDNANPRAVDIDAQGVWWVALGGPMMVASYEPQLREWKTYPIGFYPHSVAIGRSGDVWANGHFTRDPELIARVRSLVPIVETLTVPPHPRLAKVPGGPIPYEIRVAPDGRVWGSELVGNRMFSCDPVTGSFATYTMPVSFSGPRRFDVDADGVLWIPAFAANELVRFDPHTKVFRRIRIPIPDAVPYVARVDQSRGTVWIGTAAADAVLAYEPKSNGFTLYRLPSRGAMVRHLAIDSRNGDVWAAYGASPGPLPSRIARVRPRGDATAMAR